MSMMIGVGLSVKLTFQFARRRSYSGCETTDSSRNVPAKEGLDIGLANYTASEHENALSKALGTAK
jgi:hypothetical protein